MASVIKGFPAAGRFLQYGAMAPMRKALVLTIGCMLGALPVSAGTTLVAFGDSLTAGFGLPQEEGFAPQLEGWLRARGHDVSVVNAGVSGDTTAGGLARVEWTLAGEVDAVIVELGANDFLRGLPPDQARANLDGIMAAISARDVPVLLAGIPAPPNYGLSYKRDFDAIWPDLGEKYGAIVYRNFLQGVGSAGDLASVAALMQADGLHPNAKGVARIVADIGPRVEELLARVSAGR